MGACFENPATNQPQSASSMQKATARTRGFVETLYLDQVSKLLAQSLQKEHQKANNICVCVYVHIIYIYMYHLFFGGVQVEAC